MIQVASRNIEDQLDNIDQIIKVCSIIQYYRYKDRNSYIKGEYHDFNLLYQKSLIHSMSIKQLAHQIGIYDPSKDIFKKIIDPFSINVILRSTIEAYLTFYHLSSSTSEEENKLRHMIWAVFGMLQRQKLSFDESNRLYEQNERKKREEKERIDQVITNIEKHPVFMLLTADKQASIKRQFRKEWKFQFQGNTYRPKSYQEILNSVGFNNDLFANIYNNLSWSTHSTSISVAQLNNLWGNERHDIAFLRNSLLFTSSILAFMTIDLLNVDSDYSIGYEKLSEDQKQLLNDYHSFFRK
jgi:hypothetical protein